MEVEGFRLADLLIDVRIFDHVLKHSYVCGVMCSKLLGCKLE